MDESVESRQSLIAINTHVFSERSLNNYPDLVKNLLRVKTVATEANLLAGEISQLEYDRIIGGIETAFSIRTHPYYAVDVMQGGGGISIHTAVIEVLSEFSQLPPEVINRSQSTTDVLLSALNLTLAGRHRALEKELARVADSLSRFYQLSKNTPVTALTCMRKASVSRLGNLFEGYNHAITRSLRHLDNLSHCFDLICLGGTSIGEKSGTTDAYQEALPSAVAKHLPHCRWRESLIDGAQNADEWTRYLHELSDLSNSLIKLAKDLRLLSSDREHPVILMPQIIKGSTFYPGKNNPTQPETLLQATWMVKGACYSADLAHAHGELQLNVFSPFIGMSLLDAIGLLSRSLEKFDRFCLQQIAPNPNKEPQAPTA